MKPYAQDEKRGPLATSFLCISKRLAGQGPSLQRMVTAAFLFYFGFEHLREAPICSASHRRRRRNTAAFWPMDPCLWNTDRGRRTWIAFSCAGGGGISLMLAASGATLAMIGPGAWSVDARLFGRKHFEIPRR